MEPIRVSHTMLSTFRQCRLKFYWHYVEGWRPHSKSPGLAVGSAGHLALAAYYRHKAMNPGPISKTMKGMLVNTALDELVTEGYEDSKGDDLTLVLERYLDWAESTGDKNISPILSAAKGPLVELPLEVPLDDNLLLIGFVDAVVARSDETKWMMEHKFNKQASVKHLGLDPQVSMYMFALEKMGLEVSGCLYNIIRMTKGGIAASEPVLRDYAFRTKWSSQLVYDETCMQAEELRPLLAMKEYVRKMDLETGEKFLAENARACGVYRAPGRDCHWSCQFYNACMAMQFDNSAYYTLESEFTKGEQKEEISDKTEYREVEL